MSWLRRRARIKAAIAERPTELEQLQDLAEASARKAEENERRMDRIAALIRDRTSRA